MPLPALRDLDATAFQHEGQTLICLRDSEGLLDAQLVLSPAAFYIATFLDGRNEISDIQYAFVHDFGQVLRGEDVESLVESLEEAGFLLTDRYFQIRARIEAEFRARDSRPAYLAGKSYPENPDELRAFLDGLFLREGGPGETPNGTAGAGAPLPCLVVPHIDFDRGGPTYAHGYLRMARAGRPETVFIFGVAHGAPPVPFVLTRKHFETPLGTLETDRERVDRIAAACDWDPFAYEIAHRGEHSIEFQAVMLAHLYGPDVRIVPILCASVAGPDRGVSASGAAFLEACRQVVAESDGRVSVIAGADLAHVGPRFGDEFDVDEAVMRSVEARDLEDLAHAEALRPEQFLRSVLKDGNARRVCGHYCIYSALKSVEGLATRGELVMHGCAADPAGGIVSFANLAFV